MVKKESSFVPKSLTLIKSLITLKDIVSFTFNSTSVCRERNGGVTFVSTVAIVTATFAKLFRAITNPFLI